jgi:hypothetical protein
MDISQCPFVTLQQEEKYEDFSCFRVFNKSRSASGKVFTYNLWLFKFAMHHFKVCALLFLTSHVTSCVCRHHVAEPHLASMLLVPSPRREKSAKFDLTRRINCRFYNTRLRGSEIVADIYSKRWRGSECHMQKITLVRLSSPVLFILRADR